MKYWMLFLQIKDVIETHMRKARNARAKSKRKQKGQHVLSDLC